MRRSLGILSSIGVALLIGAPVQAAAGWTPPVMVWDGNYHDPAMVVDSRGHAHVAARALSPSGRVDVAYVCGGYDNPRVWFTHTK
jgi:hypothetical protein